MLIETLGRLIGDDVSGTALILPLALPVILTLYVAVRLGKRNDNRAFPPGPKCIPFIGPIISQPDIPIYLEFLNWSKRFDSDIVGYSVSPGLQKVVILNSSAAIRDALLLGRDSADALVGRQQNQLSIMMNPNRHGVGEIDGPMWVTHRRFALKVLHDLGLGRPIIEDTIRARLVELLDGIEKASTDTSDGRRAPIDPLPFAMRAVGDVVGGLIFGERLSEDPHFERVYEIFTECFQLLFKQPEFVKSFAKYLCYLPGDRFQLKFASNGMQEGAQYMWEKVQKRLVMEPSVDVHDYIDAYLIEKRKLEHDKKDFSTFCDKQLARMAWEFFAAGMDTTTTVMCWSMLLLAHHQKVQEKARKNVLEHLGTDRQACYADRLSMKYLEAVINEVHRFGGNSPLTMPRRAVRDCTIRGFQIPKDTLVLSNLWAAHHQADIWPDPYNFNPDANFTQVSDDGELELKNVEYLMPFNIGKRACIGESLARQELLIFISGILQRYRIVPSPDCPLPPDSAFEFHGIGRHPLPYKVLFVPL